MLTDLLSRLQVDLRSGRFDSEAAVSQGIVLPVLEQLAWDFRDTRLVAPQYPLEGRRVDYALCNLAGQPQAFLEVKRVGQTGGADRQLFEYAFHRGVPLAVLTDGQEWSFYLPGEAGHYDERRVYKIDLLERTPEESSERFARYLSQPRVLSGEALEAARADYRDAARVRQVLQTLPQAWQILLAEQDSLLIDLLTEKVEDLCGFRPDLETCSRFLAEVAAEGAKAAPDTGTAARPLTRSSEVPPAPARPARLGFDFAGQRVTRPAAIEVLQELLRLFAQKDATFLDRFTARRHGRKRRYVARQREDLYPDRPDLVADCSVELMPGWWLGTNYSRRSIRQIIELACEVAAVPISSLHLELGS